MFVLILNEEIKVLRKSLIIVTVAGVLTGCGSSLSPVGVGLVTDVKGPIMATGVTGTKSGTACAKTIMGVYNQGDASIEGAKAAGDISVVASADYHTKGFYPFFGETCVIVTGH